MANINASIGYNQLCNLKKTLRLKAQLFLNIKKLSRMTSIVISIHILEDSKPNNWVINLMLKDDYVKNIKIY